MTHLILKKLNDRVSTKTLNGKVRIDPHFQPSTVSEHLKE